MNIILFSQQEIEAADRKTVVIADRRFQHIKNVLHSQVGDSLRVGVINGQSGQGKIISIGDTSIELEVCFAEPPPNALNIHLILSLPRPKSLPRILQTVSSLGVKEVTFTNACKVPKYYWDSDYLSDPKVNQACLLGLEQARDTVLPKVSWERRLRPFVEDRLPYMSKNCNKYLAHPYSSVLTENNLSDKKLFLAVGPEGGWVDFEIDLFFQAGFEPFSITPRILKLETAVTALLSRLCF